MEEVLNYLSAIHPLSNELRNYLRDILKEREVPKNTYLLKRGHVNSSIYFITKGLVRCYYIKNDREISSGFMKEGDIAISVESFFKQIPSKENIQALEDCIIYYASYRDLQFAYKNFPEFNFIGRVLTEKYYMQSEQRLCSIKMQRSKERYDYLLQNNSELIQRVPAKYLASYIGLHEAYMSFVKGKK